jgi:hypothetical protein
MNQFLRLFAAISLLFGSVLPSSQAAQSGYFVDTGPMIAARAYPKATLLPDGKVLVTGGISTNGLYLSSSELYDPATGGVGCHRGDDRRPF